MGTYHRGPSAELALVDRWDGGVGWLAHPDEGGRRASHAVRAEDGVWLLDPLDAPGTGAVIEEYGSVAGVLVCSEYHARDADVFARRYDVPVTVPGWLGRVDDRLEAPIERVGDVVAGFELRRVRPLGLWREALAYRPGDGTLYVPDYLSSHDPFTVGDERVGLPTLSRLRPPRRVFADLSPDRILLGHGAGVFEAPEAALEEALAGARRRFPRALVTNLPREVWTGLAALR